MKVRSVNILALYGIIIVTGLLSCSTQKKITALKNEVAIKDNQQRLMLEKMNELDKKNKIKSTQRETDDTTSQQVQKIIDSLKRNASEDIKNDSAFLVKKKIKRKELNAIQKLIKEAEAKDVLAIDDVSLLTDLLNANTFTRLNMAAFFDPGGYIVEPDKLPGAIASFTPVAKDIQKFTSKYQSRKLRVTIVSVGYADEEPVALQTELYRKLSTNIGDTINPSRQALNAELSRLRAFSVSDLIKNVNDKEESQATLNNNRLIYLAQGRGELLPSPAIDNYTPYDERRRIVVIYWGALPEN